jgi:hypothetical protein
LKGLTVSGSRDWRLTAWLALCGAGFGFVLRGCLNSGEVIGFANISDQLFKVAVWTVAGALLGFAGGCWVISGQKNSN